MSDRSLRIERHALLPSTQLRAEGAWDDGVDLILADAQSDGQGSGDRHFDSPVGGLYMSYLYRAPIPSSRLLRLTPLCAVAVRRALLHFDICAKIKWVNDLMIGDKKICGILVRPRFEGEICVGAIVGVGVNLLDRPFPPALAGIATSVQEACGVRLDAEALAERIVSLLIPLLGGEGEEEAMDEYRSCSCLIGRRVRAEMADRTLIATVTGIDRDGGLILTDEVGRILAMRSGRVRAISESFP